MIEMPPPPNYDCPVCKKGFQRGYLAKHMHTHSQSELVKEVNNKNDVRTKSAHPEFNCSGHIYIICPYDKKAGFEKDTRLHKDHVCEYNYKDWLDVTAQSSEPVNKETVVKSQIKKNSIVEIDRANQINMILPEDDVHEDKHTTCNCHIEINKLKKALEQLNNWKELILSSVPKVAINTATPIDKNEPIIEEKIQIPVIIEAVKRQEPPAIRKPIKPKIHASKKEIEKGMWCTNCEACGTTAQYNTDLRACCNCKRMTHFNDDLTNCYHWDCTVCDKKSCYSCVKFAGGNKMKPLCSIQCANIYKSKK
jgi:hypothetical protein